MPCLCMTLETILVGKSSNVHFQTDMSDAAFIEVRGQRDQFLLRLEEYMWHKQTTTTDISTSCFLSCVYVQSLSKQLISMISKN